MEGNGDNSFSGKDHVQHTDVDTPEIRAAQQLTRSVDGIVATVKGLFDDEKGGHRNFDTRDFEKGLKTATREDGGTVVRLLMKDDDKDYLEYELRSNRTGAFSDHPGFDAIILHGRHTDLDTLDEAQDYMFTHPESRRKFSTAYYFNSAGEWEKVSTIPDEDWADTNIADNQAMQRYTRDHAIHRASRTIPLAVGEIEQAGYVVERIKEELALVTENPQPGSGSY